mmetsp:Transcript_52978/g.154332  ORF Transcript_52978/g.154332 Transcript_52978/m.154332 type:complete len:489 (-) Transcript_52978:105-1571(-)
MSGLPPYSTYRTDNKQMMFPQAISHGNVLTFTPPGFTQSLNVKFPDSRLAVCEKCKKNFKTRDMCRVRNTHTTAPWTTAYICLTLDESCTDAEGNYIDKPLTVRMVQWQPYQVKTPFDPKTPVCSACKKTNRTRSFCRERHKHRQLPWCTVYVLLSALETADPATVVADPSKPVKQESNTDTEKDEPKEVEVDTKAASIPGEGTDEVSAAESKASDSVDGENIKPNDGKKSSLEPSDDIHDIAESRTFLAKVNCEGTTIHWLELADYEGEHSGIAPPGHIDPSYAMMHQVPPGDPNAHYYHPAMGYSAQQHHNALKSQQQYFFHMQRHQQHHAAQYAAWQAHYGPPPHLMHGQLSPQANTQSVPSEGSSSPVPVTAGEAAAQQQKRNRQMLDDGNGSTSSPPHPHGMSHQPPPGQPPHGQQQWMLYQQMYQAQLPPMGHPPPYPPRPPGLEGGSPEHGAPGSDYAAPSTPQGNGDPHHEHETKRQRRS